MPRRRSKKQQRLQGEGFWDTITSWGRTLRDYPKLIVDGPKPAPPGSTSSEGLPDKSILKDIADNSYKGTSDEMKGIPGYTLKFKSPTLVIYQKDGENVMVIGVRGTADFRDFRAWFSTAFNVIPDSQRFKEDIAEISKFQQEYPLSAYTYYATGHSLGGTLIDELIKKGMVKEARTYNPAIETDDIPNVALSQKNHRIYADGDPLYLLQGRYDNPTEVRKSYKYYPSSAMDFIPGYDKYKQHVLANPVFIGGKTKKGRKVVMDPKDYYAEHRNIVSLLNKTGEALQTEAQDQKMEAKQMAKKLGHANPFYHLRGAGMMANSQFYRTDPKRNPLLSGGDSVYDHFKHDDSKPMDDAYFKNQAKEYNDRQKGYYDGYKSDRHWLTGGDSMDFDNVMPMSGMGIFDDIKHGLKKGAEDIFGKMPERAELTPEQQADSRRRQWIQDVDKRRAEMVAKKKKYAMDNLMENAQHKNVLQAYYRSVGTDNPKDYLQKVVEMATKTAEEFYPYENFKK